MKRYSLKKPFLRNFFGQLVPHDLPLEENPEGEWVRFEDLPAPNGWIALKDALPKEGKTVQLVSDGIHYEWQILAERIGEHFVSSPSRLHIDLAEETNVRWAYVVLPEKPE